MTLPALVRERKNPTTCVPRPVVSAAGSLLNLATDGLPHTITGSPNEDHTTVNGSHRRWGVRREARSEAEPPVEPFAAGCAVRIASGREVGAGGCTDCVSDLIHGGLLVAYSVERTLEPRVTLTVSVTANAPVKRNGPAGRGRD